MKSSMAAVLTEPVVFRLADVVAVKIKLDLAVVALNREHLLEHRLEADVLAPGGRDIDLQELGIGVGLQFDEIRRSDDLFDFTEVDSFSGSRWHLSFRVGPAPTSQWFYS